MSNPPTKALTEEEICREVLGYFKVEQGEIAPFLSLEDGGSSKKLHETVLSQFEDSERGEQCLHDLQASQEKLKATILGLHDDVTTLKKDPVLQNIIKHEALGDVDKVVSEDLEDVAAQLHVMNGIIGFTLSIVALVHAPQSLLGMMKSNAQSGVESASGYVDGLAMMASGLRQYREGHRAAAAITMATGTGLAACTMAANITATIGSGGASLSAGLLGFSYVGALAVMTGMSTGRMLKAKHRRERAEKSIASLNEQLNVVDREINQLADKVDSIQAKLIDIDTNLKREKLMLPKSAQTVIDLYEQKEKLEVEHAHKLQEIEHQISTLSDDDAHENAIAIIHIEKDKLKAEGNVIEARQSLDQKIKAYPLEDDNTREVAELYQQRINLKEEIASLYQKKSEKIEEKQDLESNMEQQIAFKFKESAKEKDHARAAKGFAAATIALGTLATVSFLALSGVTFCALPAATIVLSVAVLAINYLRHKWASKLSHTSNLAESKAFKLTELRKNLKNNQCGIDLDRPLALTSTNISKLGNTLMSKKSLMTFREYFDDLILNDPKKAKKVMEAYQKNDKVAFKKAVSQKRTQDVKGKDRDFYHGIINSPKSGKAMAKAYKTGGRKGLLSYLEDKKQAYQSLLGGIRQFANVVSEKTGIKKFRSTGLEGADLTAYQLLESNPERMDVLMHEFTKEHDDGKIEHLAEAVEALPTYSEETTGMKLLKASAKPVNKREASVKEKQADDEGEGEGESGQADESKDDDIGMSLD